jgi:hypothetical protein
MGAMSEASAAYKEKYGAWAGMPAGRKPNLELCCVEVADCSLRWPTFHQCSRKRGHGPDGAYCKQHDPDVVKARDAANTSKAHAKWNNERYQTHGRTFYTALEKIAAGHNDARGLAQEVIDEFKNGEYR